MSEAAPTFQREYFKCEENAKVEIRNPNFRRPGTAARTRMDTAVEKAQGGTLTVKDLLDAGYTKGNLKHEWMHGAIAIEGAGMVERKQVTAEEKERIKAEKAAERAAKKAEKDAERAAAKAEKEKAKAEAKAKREAEREKAKAEREAKKAAEREARQAAKTEAAQAAANG